MSARQLLQGCSSGRRAGLIMYSASVAISAQVVKLIAGNTGVQSISPLKASVTTTARAARGCGDIGGVIGACQKLRFIT